jgi:hypothetical protein
VKGTRCVEAGISTHEVVAGRLGSGRAAAAGEDVSAGGCATWIVCHKL